MPLYFRGDLIPGLVEPWSPAEWDQQTEFTSVFGVPGVGYQFGGRLSRTLSVPLWYANEFTTVGALETALRALDGYVGLYGPLIESQAIVRTFPLCLLESVQRRDAIIPPNPHIGWTQKLTLNFRQLRP